MGGIWWHSKTARRTLQPDNHNIATENTNPGNDIRVSSETVLMSPLLALLCPFNILSQYSAYVYTEELVIYSISSCLRYLIFLVEKLKSQQPQTMLVKLRKNSNQDKNASIKATSVTQIH